VNYGQCVTLITLTFDVCIHKKSVRIKAGIGLLRKLIGGFKVCIHNRYMGRRLYIAEMRDTMATIYVRIPRNRWTPIGEIDLDGSQAVYYGRRGGLVHLYPDVGAAMRRALSLTREIFRYRRRHVKTLHGKRLRRNRRYDQHIKALERRLRLVSPYRLLEEQAKRTGQKRRRERRR